MYEKKLDEVPDKRGKPSTINGDPCMVEAEFVLQLKDILRDSPVKIYSESLPLLNMGGGLGHEFYPICVSYIAHEKIYQQWNKYLLFRLLYVISSFKIIWYIYIFLYLGFLK